MRRPRTLAGRLLSWLLPVFLLLLSTLGLVLDRVLERDVVASFTSSLASQARTVQAAIPDDGTLEAAVRRLGAASDVRITVIRTDGVVLADSERDPATLENHLDRPEVRQALTGIVGTSSRRSATLGVELRYVALPPADGRVVRLAVPLTRVRTLQTTVRVAIAAGMSLLALATLVAVLLVGRGVARPIRRMTGPLQRLGEGDLSARVQADGTEETTTLASTVNTMADRLEAQLRASLDGERQRDLILSSMQEGVVLADGEGRVTFANGAAQRYLGNAPASVSTILPIALREALDATRRSGTPSSASVEAGAVPRWLDAAVVPVTADGSVLLVLRDVTESRRLETVRRDFVSNASHELKTPAASLRAGAETIRRAARDDPEAVVRFADQMERDALRLSRIVSDLLDLSRLEAGSDEGGDVRLDDVVREEMDRLHDLAAGHDVRLVLDAEQVTVRGSARDLTLLVRNLAENGLHYSQPGGEVAVSVRREDGDAVLRVADSGIGIPRRDLPRIFERFYRVDQARSRATGGTGLGLAIVKHVAENHGGTVRVESELGEGSTFEVRLPAS